VWFRQSGKDFPWALSRTGRWMSTASECSIAMPGRRTRQRSCCCTAFPPPATCSAISSRNSRIGFASSLPTCRRLGVRHAGAERFHLHVREYRERYRRFAEVIGLHRFAIYVFDYGAPVGCRLAVRHPDPLTAILSQNGNAYEEGLSDGWTPFGPTGKSRRRPTGRRSAASSLPRRRAGNTRTVCPT
jgi:pimeloyl-ACP methyl ester carboxylesterase